MFDNFRTFSFIETKDNDDSAKVKNLTDLSFSLNVIWTVMCQPQPQRTN